MVVALRMLVLATRRQKRATSKDALVCREVQHHLISLQVPPY